MRHVIIGGFFLFYKDKAGSSWQGDFFFSLFREKYATNFRKTILKFESQHINPAQM